MIKHLLHKISVNFYDTQVQQLDCYERMKQHEGWSVHQGIILTIANEIALLMLSEKFAKLDKDEKDAQQRAFYHTKEIIDFLLDPLKGANKHAAIKQYTKKLGATKRKRPKER